MKKIISLLLALMLVTACLSGLAFAEAVSEPAAEPEARWTNGTDTKEGTIAEINESCWEVGGTVTLLKDVFMADRTGERSALYCIGNLTLDLNGHILGTNGYGMLIDGTAEVTTIKDSVGGGMIIGGDNTALMIRGGKVILENVTLYSIGKNALNLPRGCEGSTITNCRLISEIDSALVFGGDETDVSLTITDSLIASASAVPAVATSKKTGTFAVDELTKFCSGSDFLSADVTMEGKILQDAEPTTVEVQDAKYENLKTATAIVGEAPVETPVEETPVETPVEETPVETPVEETPSTDGETTANDDKAPADEDNNTALIVGIAVAGVIAVIVVVVIVVKKKKA